MIPISATTDQTATRPRAKNWPRRRIIAVGTALLGLVAWLLWTPPTISRWGISQTLECQPIGRGAGSDVSMLGAMSGDEAAFVDAYTDTVFFSGPLTDERMVKTKFDIQAGVARECSAARTNRLAILIVVAGVGLGWLAVEAAALVVRKVPSNITGLSARRRVTGTVRQVSSRAHRALAVVVIGMLVAGWAVLVGWLLLSAPTVEQAGVAARLECQPIGKGAAGDSLLTVPSRYSEFVDEYIDKSFDVNGYTYEQRDQRIELDHLAPSEVFRVCSDARTNRMTSLVLAVGGGLALVVVGAASVVIRRLTTTSATSPEGS